MKINLKGKKNIIKIIPENDWDIFVIGKTFQKRSMKITTCFKDDKGVIDYFELNIYDLWSAFTGMGPWDKSQVENSDE